MECARLPAKVLDEESADWLRRLGADGGERQAAERELHARLVRIALAEVRRRSASTPATGPELDDVAHQAAGDAMIAIIRPNESGLFVHPRHACSRASLAAG